MSLVLNMEAIKTLKSSVLYFRSIKTQIVLFPAHLLTLCAQMQLAVINWNKTLTVVKTKCTLHRTVGILIQLLCYLLFFVLISCVLWVARVVGKTRSVKTHDVAEGSFLYSRDIKRAEFLPASLAVEMHLTSV